MNVAIIGCGLIGKKRANALHECCLIACTDEIFERAQALASQIKTCVVVQDWQDVVADPKVDIIIVATTHNVLAEITAAAVRQGKHVLVEKPAARHADELPIIIELAKTTGSLVRVGFNHRYHRAFRQARMLIDQGNLGELMFLRARYGHGGRLGYEKEWRAIPALSGGGELIDQGAHLIDLSRWFLGDFTEINGFATTYYWDMSVDDNAFLLLKNDKKQVAFLQASCTEWKNLFSFEIYGRQAKLDITGLGGSYGIERLAFHKMLSTMGPPETMIWEYPRPDDSWEIEFKEFLQDIQLHRQPSPGLNDAYAVLKIVSKVYEN